QSFESRIIGGQAAADGQIPYQVGIVFDDLWFCGGSIIDVLWILTAAHCTDGAGFATIYAGNTTWLSGVNQTVSSNNFRQHSGYESGKFVYDISLIKLDKPLEFGPRIGMIGLPPLTGPYDTYAGQTVMISGWGRTSNQATTLPTDLQYAFVKVITNLLCGLSYPLTIKDSHLCTSTASGKATCNGDSGGPATIEVGSTGNIQVGIVSFGSGLGCDTLPSVFTRVTSYRGWIYENHVVHQSNFIQHHAYDTRTINNDISLIRTPHVDFWSLVNKVELPRYDDRYNNYYGWWGLLSGWGKTSDEGGVSDYLNCVDIQIADNSICEAHYGTTTITPNHVCIATPENKGSCSGDSGGPLVLHDDNRQVAIVSFGSSAGCLSNSPKGMTRVTSYLDWIRDNTGI
ncbi:hypothetical protein KR054_010738, partial [Drosophila jambulina]